MTTTAASSTLLTPAQVDYMAHLQSELDQKFKSLKGHAHRLIKTYRESPQDLKTVSQEVLAALSLAGAIAIPRPLDATVMEKVLSEDVAPEKHTIIAEISVEEQQAIFEKMKAYVKQPAGHLPKEEELYLEQQVSDILGFEVTAELEGNRLNHSIGIMGGEQHLKRFPDDTLSQHDAYVEAGIAPNRGAFGWFTEQGQLTEKAIQREKYYFAVQTMYLPNWNTDHPHLKEWYKFRKMVVINPFDQVAVVGVVGDAGPAQWVQKQFGGSPEIIREGKVWSPQSRGHIILLFVDDPEDKIPLGPIDLKTLPEKIPTT